MQNKLKKILRLSEKNSKDKLKIFYLIKMSFDLSFLDCIFFFQISIHKTCSLTVQNSLHTFKATLLLKIKVNPKGKQNQTMRPEVNRHYPHFLPV